MRKRMVASILIGLTLILSTFISAVSIVQRIAYAQMRTQQSSNGVPALNSMTQRSTVLGSNAEPGRNNAVQGLAGALSSVHVTPPQHPVAVLKLLKTQICILIAVESSLGVPPFCQR